MIDLTEEAFDVVLSRFPYSSHEAEMEVSRFMVRCLFGVDKVPTDATYYLPIKLLSSVSKAEAEEAKAYLEALGCTAAILPIV